VDLGGPARDTARIVIDPSPRRAARAGAGAWLLLGMALTLSPSWAEAHPAPFSFLDLLIGERGIRGSLIVHDLDAAHDLSIEPADQLLDRTIAETYRARLQDLLGERLRLEADGSTRLIEWTGLEVVPERFGLKLSFTLGPRPARLDIHAVLFPYDPIHQTFVNIYEEGTLRQQSILTADDPSVRFFAGTTQGRWSVVRTFLISGIEHILIGPDHVLFLIGLLLPGGTLKRLALIVTAFTIGHSLTLSLAALDIFSPPVRIIEPLIALTIVVVGTDNLFVIADRRRTATPAAPAAPVAPEGTRPHPPAPAKDARPLFAGFFGLIHGFGFASVLKEFGLPAEALAWSLVSFNIGVEIGQLIIVATAATILALVTRARPALSQPLARWGSVGVILAGTYWFVDRLFGTGGGA
jgi:hydrogenase/urease accessory protein HupE